jgi:hypothetical protein
MEEIEKDFEDYDVGEHIIAALHEALDYEQGKKCPGIIVRERSLPETNDDEASDAYNS